ncbi:MAG: selenium-dependent xanthine dehydrogenase [Clostridiaceae bacterium]|jgi:aldehyde oxidoreductase|nr:selenium-dependent xanthine dehydrogenase [Clostridiaceae bacterium]
MDEKYTFTVNGKEVSTGEDKALLTYLRDDLKLKSVKDGCSQGTCGTCTVIIDGRALKACTSKTSKLEGKTVITTEGLSETEREAYVYAFGVTGAVQCGFCTPGMIMSSKALLDKDPNPSEEDIKKALRTNICRCTGYKKIIEGVQLTAAILRGEEEIDSGREEGADYGVGLPAFRNDVREKVTGTGLYTDDVEMEGMLHASAIRSAYPRARILDIDFSAALELPGVVAVYTADDVPNNKVGHIMQDWDVMIAKGDVTRFVGDAVALLVAENEAILEEAKALVKIDYEELKAYTSIEAALADDADDIHPGGNMCQYRHITRGDVRTAFENSAHVITQSFSTPFTEHAFLEPECSVAFPYKDGVKVLSSDQSTHAIQEEISIMLGWDPDRIVVENLYVGGAFGGKEDASVQHLAALCAVNLNKPVKVKLSRDESLAFHPKRHPMEATFTLACDEEGMLTGLDADIYFDTGAYASLCGPVLERACTHSVGPYTYQNTDIRGYGVYTNNVPSGAYRGFGVCQTEFALECMMDLLAEKVGISPWEIRYRNAIEPGKVLPNGQIADESTALKETLEAVKDIYEANRERAGLACAMKNTGVGVGLPDKGRARLEVHDGKVEVFCGASDLGQGSTTVFAQMVAELSGLGRKDIHVHASNTENSPDSGMSSGSRQTLVSGEAVRMATKQFVEAMNEVDGDLTKLEGREFEAEYFEPTDELGADKANPKSHIAYAYATHLVILDDEGRVSDIYAAHDSGKVVNPLSIQGQIEGGVLMGMGYALTEDFKTEDGYVKSKFGTLGLLRSTDIPNIHAIYVEKKDLLDVAYGAKGIGEITTIPTAPAAQNAYYVMDGILRNTLPMTETAYSKPKKEFGKKE